MSKSSLLSAAIGGGTILGVGWIGLAVLETRLRSPWRAVRLVTSAGTRFDHEAEMKTAIGSAEAAR